MPGYSGSHFGSFRLIEGDTSDIDPGSPAECPELHAHFASVLQLLLAGVVDELKEARLDIAAAVEQRARQRLRAPSAVRRIERFVGDVTPLAVDAKAIAPWLRARPQLSWTMRRDGIIPFAMKSVARQVDFVQLRVGHLDPFWICAGVDLGLDAEPLVGACAADELDHDFVAH